MDKGVRSSQKNYRSLLEAMSRPGRLVRLSATGTESPYAAVMAIGECLLDHEVSLCVIGNGGAKALQATLVAATQVRIESLEKADFVFVVGGQGRGRVCRAKRGFLESPEEGATLVYCINSRLTNASDRFRIRLVGPGIAGQGGIVPEKNGVPVEEFRELMVVNSNYPLGVDIFFVWPNGELIGIPRSTHIQVR